jgi:hypothetical protein
MKRRTRLLNVETKSWIAMQNFLMPILRRRPCKKSVLIFETLQPLLLFLNEGLHAGE